MSCYRHFWQIYNKGAKLCQQLKLSMVRFIENAHVVNNGNIRARISIKILNLASDATHIAKSVLLHIGKNNEKNTTNITVNDFAKKWLKHMVGNVDVVVKHIGNFLLLIMLMVMVRNTDENLVNVVEDNRFIWNLRRMVGQPTDIVCCV